MEQDYQERVQELRRALSEQQDCVRALLGVSAAAAATTVTSSAPGSVAGFRAFMGKLVRSGSSTTSTVAASSTTAATSGANLPASSAAAAPAPSAVSNVSADAPTAAVVAGFQAHVQRLVAENAALMSDLSSKCQQYAELRMRVEELEVELETSREQLEAQKHQQRAQTVAAQRSGSVAAKAALQLPSAPVAPTAVGIGRPSVSGSSDQFQRIARELAELTASHHQLKADFSKQQRATEAALRERDKAQSEMATLKALLRLQTRSRASLRRSNSTSDLAVAAALSGGISAAAVNGRVSLDQLNVNVSSARAVPLGSRAQLRQHFKMNGQGNQLQASTTADREAVSLGVDLALPPGV